MNERVTWHDLPAALRARIEQDTGPVVRVDDVPDGLNCSLALVLETRDHGTVFVKGVRTSDAAGTAGLRCEEEVNAAVREVGPAVRHRFEADGWFCLAFDRVEGRHVQLGPGTRDLKAVATTLQRMHDLPALSGVPQLGDRLTAHLSPGEAHALRGRHLLHTDTHPHNILIGDTDGEAHLVDWAMPALGPAWVDAASTAVRLMECGQPPHAARDWLGQFRSWRTAEPRAVEAFVNGTCRQWTATIGERDAEPSNARFRRLLD